MAVKTLAEKITSDAASFDTWRVATNTVAEEEGDLNNLTQDLKDNTNLVTAINETYDTTQIRLKRGLILAIGMS